MPTLLRFLLVVGAICGTGYAGIYALAYYVNPPPREITVIVPQSELNRHR